MGVESIRAVVEAGDPAGDGFLGAAVEVAFGEVDGVAELDDVAEEVGAMAEAFEDAGDVGSARFGAPGVVDFGEFAGGVGVFNEVDFQGVFGH